QGGEFVGIRRRRIRFQSDFGVRGNTERRCGRIEYALHLLWFEQAGRTATEKDGLQRPLVRQRLPGTNLRTDRLDIAIVQGSMPGQDGEGAIRAALRAEGDMHIQAKGL